MFLRIIFAVGIAFAPTVANAAEWIEVNRNSKFITYVDRESINRNGDIIKSWQKRVYLSGGREKTVALVENNCATSQSRILQIATYEKDGSGDVLSAPPEGSRWSYVIPDSLGMQTHEFLCGK